MNDLLGRDGARPHWLDAFTLEVLADACSVELGRIVRLPTERVRVIRRRRQGGLRGGGAPGRVGISDPFRLRAVYVTVRDDARVAAILDAPREAWEAGCRSGVQLAAELYLAVAAAEDISGAREFLGAWASLVFLECNGLPARASAQWFGLGLDRLVEGRPDGDRGYGALAVMVGP